MQVLAQSFEEQVLQYLQKEYPEYEKIEIQTQNNFSADKKITIDFSKNINLSKGVAFIPVIAIKGNKTSSSVVSVKVKLFKKLLVAKRNFDRKEVLLKSEFEEKVMNVTQLNGHPIESDFVVSELPCKIIH